jgi:hypothetical protein
MSHAVGGHLTVILVVLFGAIQTLAYGDLSIRVDRGGEELVGYAASDNAPDLYWFVLVKDQPTLLAKLPLGGYHVKLLCAESIEDIKGRTVLKDGERSKLVFRPITPLWNRDTGVFYGKLRTKFILFGPTNYAGAITLQSCDLQRLLLPVLLKKTEHFAPGEEVWNVLGMSGNKSLQTPTEILMSHLISIDSDRREAQRVRERAEQLQQVTALVMGQAEIWSRGQGRPLGREPLTDSKSNIFLGVLAATVEPAEVQENHSAVVTVQYFPSHESLSERGSNVSYELEVTQEPPMLDSDHVQVRAEHEHSNQEIVPTVDHGIWKFDVKTLPGFNGCDLALRYRVRKLLAGHTQREITSGQFLKNARIELKPEIVIPPLTIWQRVKGLIEDFAGTIGWLLATILSGKAIYDWIENRRKRRRMVVEANLADLSKLQSVTLPHSKVETHLLRKR